MKSCSEISELLYLYVDDGLDHAARIHVEEHIKQCDDCKSQLEQIREITRLCSEIEEEELPANFRMELHEKLIQAKEQAGDEKRSIFRRSRYLKACSAIAACFIVLAFTYSLLNSSSLFGGVSSADPSSEITPESSMAVMDQDASMKMKDREIGDAGVSIMNIAPEVQTDDPDAVDLPRDPTLQGRGTSDTEISSMASAVSNYTVSGTQPQKDAEKIKTLALDYGAVFEEPVDIAFSLALPTDNTENSEEGSAENHQQILNFKLPTDKLQQFQDSLIANYHKENVEVPDATVTAGYAFTGTPKPQEEDLRRQLKEIEKKMDALKNNDDASDQAEMEKLLDEKKRIEEEIKGISIGQEQEYAEVTVVIKTK